MRQASLSRLSLTTLFVCCLWLATSALSGPPARRPPRSDDRRITAVRVGRATPHIDGRLDDAAWREARWVSDFTQKEPDQGRPATLRTEVALVYDDDALYIGARMASAGRHQIASQMTRRDEPGNTERLIVSLDTYHDHRTAYSFALTAAGVRIDYFHPIDNEYERDFTFDAVWEAQTDVGEDGWTAEIRIPFSQLRFSKADEQVWGINLNRWIPAINEDDFWVVVPRETTAWSSRFGELVGIRGIRPSRRMEIVPYVASEARRTSDGLLDRDDPFHDATDVDARAGVDFKMGLGPNLTLDAALNPDFGQVEADPAEVNLTAFETVFEERRPFFTEGSQNLTGQGPTFYYSRRIGASPHLPDDAIDADFVDSPGTTTILGAAKVTGQTARGLSVGGLAALTSGERARTFDLADGRFDALDVEPRTAYGVLRLQQQFGADASTVGITLTGLDRDLTDGTLLADRLARRAYAGGVDWNRRFQGGGYELLGHAAFSRVEGDPAAITRVQESSVHYFQRPDAEHVALDPGATSLSGWSAALRGGKRSGKWRWNSGVWADSPGFEINDVGQTNKSDDISQWVNLFYRVTEPGDVFRNWEVNLFSNNNWNFGGVHRYQNLGLHLAYTLINFWNGFLETGIEPSIESDVATRGGPLMIDQGDQWIAGGVFNNFAARNRWGVKSDTWWGRLGWSWRVDPEFHLQATDRLILSFLPRYIRTNRAQQFIDSFHDGPEATFGGRYVFGRIAQSEIATPVRANFSFSPTLSLDLYAEPFAASGRYDRIGELAEPRTDRLTVYGEAEGTTLERSEDGDYVATSGGSTIELDNPDFDVLSFRSNLVLRWEWRPGSALFLVWQQNRSHDAVRGRLVRPGDLLDTLTADGDNVLAVKFSYWLPM